MTGSIVLDHPSWGLVRLVTIVDRAGDDEPNGEGVVAALSSESNVLWVQRTGPDSEVYSLLPHKPATDSSGNYFLTYNPGRYEGVAVLRPIDGGFETWQSLWGQFNDGYGRYYYADLVKSKSGRFVIRQYDNSCDPSCAGGNISFKDLYWNGSEYKG